MTKEKIINIIKAFIILFSIGYLFYRNIVYSLLLSSFALLYPKLRNKQKKKEDQVQLNNEFKETLFMLSTSLKAGKSIETSFEEILYEIDKTRYPLMYKEISIIVKKLSLNISIEKAIDEFASKSKSTDIRDFADIFIICKRTEGNLIQVIQNTSLIMSEKIATKKEIYTLIAQRRYEQKLLMCMPFVVILIMSITNSDYMSVMYTSIKGKIIMTVSLFLITTSYYISQKIMNIEV